MLLFIIYYKPAYWRLKPKIVTGLGEFIFQWLFFGIEIDIW